MHQSLNPAAEFAYSPRVQELFNDLRHAGAAADATASVTVGSREQGASITLQVTISDGVMQTIRYRAYGCPYFLAGCESLARTLQGKPIAALDKWNGVALEAELHAPPIKRSRWLLLDDAVQQMAKRSIE